MLASDRHMKTAYKLTNCDERFCRDGEKTQPQLIETNHTEFDGLNCERGELDTSHQTKEGAHRQQTRRQLDYEQSPPHPQLQMTSRKLGASGEPKDDESRSTTSSASGVEGQIYLGIYTGTRAEIKRGRRSALRTLIDELIDELICETRRDATDVGTETDTEDADTELETNGASEAWPVASRGDGRITTTVEGQREFDRGYPRRLSDFDEDQRKRYMCESGMASDTRDAMRLTQIINAWERRGTVSWDNETGNIGLSAVESVHTGLHISDLAHARAHTRTHKRAHSHGRKGKPFYLTRVEERRWRGSRGFRYHARLADMGRALRERG